LAKESRLTKALKAIAKAATSRPATKTDKRMKSYSLEELIAVTKRKSKSLEERIPRSEELMSRAEILYRLDPLIWSGVNKLTRLIATPKIFFVGEDEDVKVMNRWITSIGLRSLLPDLIKDIFIYGYAVAEIRRTDKGVIEKLSQINPITFDYIRESNKYIKRDSKGDIEGYRQKLPSENDPKIFKPREVILLKFYSLGEECLGLSPVEACFRASWIRLNLEEAIGEAIFRHGFPLFYYKIGSPESESRGRGFVTPEKINDAKEILAGLDTANELILPWWITPGRIDAKAQIGDISNLLQYFAALILTAFEVPKVYGVSTVMVQGNVGQESMDFEKTIQTMQEMIVTQLMEQLFLADGAPEMEEFPKLVFTQYNPEQKTLKARRLSQFAKYNLITRDSSVENAIRESEGIARLSEEEKSKACLFYPEKIKICPIMERIAVLDAKSMISACNICSLKAKEDGEVIEEEKPEEEIPEGEIPKVDEEEKDPLDEMES